jgi:hypothetical protein
MTGRLNKPAGFFQEPIREELRESTLLRSVGRGKT